MSAFGDDISFPEVSRRYIPKLGKHLTETTGLESGYQPFELSKGFTGNEYTVFWGLTENGENFVSVGGEKKEDEVVRNFRNLYSRIEDNPSERDVKNFIAYSEKLTDEKLTPNHSGVITVRDMLTAEDLEIQVYVDSGKESIEFATTSTGRQNEAVQEENIAGRADKDDFADFLDKVMYDTEKELSRWNYLETDNDLEPHGFQDIGHGEVPESVNPHERYRREADVYQIPASKTGLQSSSGFVKVYDLNQMNGLLVGSTDELDPVRSFGEVVSMLNSGDN